MMVKKKLRLESFTKMQINDCPTMLQSKKDITFFFFFPKPLVEVSIHEIIILKVRQPSVKV